MDLEVDSLSPAAQIQRSSLSSSRRLLPPAVQGRAAVLNRFLVAQLFHYLIGKRVSTPRCVWTPLRSRAVFQR